MKLTQMSTTKKTKNNTGNINSISSNNINNSNNNSKRKNNYKLKVNLNKQLCPNLSDLTSNCCRRNLHR